jgi:hypothetical protein
MSQHEKVDKEKHEIKTAVVHAGQTCWDNAMAMVEARHSW